MPQSKALIGIDWGTHSSKWKWTIFKPDTDGALDGQYKILRSEVCLDDNRNIFLSVDAPGGNTISISSIKGKLIQNPDAPFWTGPQKRIRLTLGELASFSLWFLLSEASDDLCRISEERPDELEVRFSIPNWVDTQGGAVGRACYEQAARVACHLFKNDRGAWSRNSRPESDDWHRRVQGALTALGLSDDSEIDNSADGFRKMLSRVYEVDQDISFRFVAESSAAGLSGLRRSGNVDHGYLLKIWLSMLVQVLPILVM